MALLPGVLFRLWSSQRRLRSLLDAKNAEVADHSRAAIVQSSQIQTVSEALTDANRALQRQVKNLTALRDITLEMSTTLDRQALLTNVIEVTTQVMQFDRTVVLLVDDQRVALRFGAASHSALTPEAQFRLEQLEIPLGSPRDLSLMEPWESGHSVLVKDARHLYAETHGWIFAVLDMTSLLGVPLMIGSTFLGVIIVDNHFTQTPISEEEQSLLEALGANIGIALENARLYQLTDEELNKHVQQLDMMRQVDRELMEALNWERALNMTLDWGLRMTGAHAASLAVVDNELKELSIVASYGQDSPTHKPENTRLAFGQGIMGRVAQTGKAEIVDNVSGETGYLPRTPQTKSTMAVPILRRGRVIAVLNLEGLRPGSFTTEHLDFAQQLANRASVALDNARLLMETQRERQKLSSILEKTVDVVIVVSFDLHVILLNEAALAVFRLNPHDVRPGMPFQEVFAYTPLAAIGERVLTMVEHHPIAEDVVLNGERYFHTHIVPNEQVGWVIIMHDITPFKETEQLKNELIATVSHDLKNPLSVINGYIELLSMYGDQDQREQEFMSMIRRSIRTMRQLIDDLLDLAHIDAGLELNLEPINLYPVIEDSVTGLNHLAEEKSLTLAINVPQDDLPLVDGDKKRLRQILTNLVSNAIKYTPPEGQVTVSTRVGKDMLTVSIEDNGLGISPEDQAQIFERFYRVRRPETDAIEGTGLGLAIVKSLVEAHGGAIGLNSRLGEGSTFFFTIPLTREPVPAHAPGGEPVGR